MGKQIKTLKYFVYFKFMFKLVSKNIAIKDHNFAANL